MKLFNFFSFVEKQVFAHDIMSCISPEDSLHAGRPFGPAFPGTGDQTMRLKLFAASAVAAAMALAAGSASAYQSDGDFVLAYPSQDNGVTAMVLSASAGGTLGLVDALGVDGSLTFAQSPSISLENQLHGELSFPLQDLIGGAGDSNLLTNLGDQQLKPFTETVIGVPEPASWSLMIVGMGAVGAILRTRRRKALAVA
jgi:hypothetical protein